jgi:hypothetical protein
MDDAQEDPSLQSSLLCVNNTTAVLSTFTPLSEPPFLVTCTTQAANGGKHYETKYRRYICDF